MRIIPARIGRSTLGEQRELENIHKLCSSNDLAFSAVVQPYPNAQPTHIVKVQQKVNSSSSSSLWNKFKGWNDIFFTQKRSKEEHLFEDGYKRWKKKRQKREFHGNQMVRCIFADCWRQKGCTQDKGLETNETGSINQRTSRWRSKDFTFHWVVVVILFAFVHIAPRSDFWENHVWGRRVIRW